MVTVCAEQNQSHSYLQWHHVPTGDNPSDQGRRGIESIKVGLLWFTGGGGVVGVTTLTNAVSGIWRFLQESGHLEIFPGNTR